MAIRLLQLCTGSQPYTERDVGPWRQLREQLGEVEVTCTKLDGAERIEWIIDPSKWPEDPPPTPPLLASNGDPGICRSVQINGKPADLEQVQSLIRVHRLVGDETLVASILSEVSAQHRRASEERERFERRAEEIGDVLEALRDLLEKAEPSTVAQARQALESSRERLDESQKEIVGADERLSKLKDLSLRQRQLESLLEEHEDPEAHLLELKKKVKEIRGELETVRTEKASLNLQAEAEAAAVEEIKDLEKRIKQQEEDREERLIEVGKLCAKLKLGEVPEGVGEDSYKAPAAIAREGLRKLLAVQAEFDAGPQVRELGERVVELLDEENVSAIKEQPLASLEGERRVSAEELSAGIELRGEEIESERGGPQADELEKAIAGARKVVSDIEELGTLLRKHKRQESKLAKARTQLKERAEALPGAEGEKFAELEARAQELAEDEESTDAAMTHLIQQMSQVASGTSEKTLRERLGRDLEAEKTDSESIAGDLEAQSELLRELRDTQHELSLAVEADEVGLRAAEADREEAIAQMAGLERWAPLRDSGLLPEAELEDDHNEERTKALLARCQGLEEALDDVSSLVAERLLAGFAAAQHGERALGESVQSVVAEIESSLGRQYFDDPTVAAALFESGELVRFDLQERLVVWKPEGAEPVTRHLDAFSSGERAFAYTKARLVRLQHEPPTENRLVALDEFGAFLERSRLELLERYLAEEVVGHFVEQALIILPLSRSGGEQESPFITIPYEL